MFRRKRFNVELYIDDDGWATIYYGNERYRCRYQSSQDGQWTIAHERSERTPNIFTFYRNQFRSAQSVERPDASRVSNSGVAVVVDILRLSAERGGCLHVFDHMGNRVLQHHFDSNLGPCAITADSRFIATSTFNPDCSTYLFEFPSKKCMWKIANPMGNILSLEFFQSTERWNIGCSSQRNHAGPDYCLDIAGDIVWESNEVKAVRLRETILSNLKKYEEKDQLKLLNQILEHPTGGRAAPNNVIHLKLANIYWKRAQQKKKEDPLGDARWSALLAAYSHFSEALPWHDAQKGLAKTLRAQADLLQKSGNQDRSIHCIREIRNMEQEFGTKLLSKGDVKRLESG